MTREERERTLGAVAYAAQAIDNDSTRLCLISVHLVLRAQEEAIQILESRVAEQNADLRFLREDTDHIRGTEETKAILNYVSEEEVLGQVGGLR